MILVALDEQYLPFLRGEEAYIYHDEWGLRSVRYLDSSFRYLRLGILPCHVENRSSGPGLSCVGYKGLRLEWARCL